MLVEIQCDKFIRYGEIKQPIHFHAVLNTVIGDDTGSNSIGKSTFLMILDFVFGGKDYVNKCLDVQENVGEHIINFRVWKRDTLDEERPLKAAKDEKTEYAIKRYMQLYGKYASVEAQIKQAKTAEEERDAFKKSSDYKHIRAAKNKTEYEDNEKRINALKTQERELAEQSNKGLLELDSFQSRRW